MKISIICFTERGLCTALRTGKMLEQNYVVAVYARYAAFSAKEQRGATFVEEPLADWTLTQQHNKNALLFVGAMGIAVRAIASGIRDKLTDSPVLVMDEGCHYVIPVVGGHMGGANALALEIAQKMDILPVITTATDLEGGFSVDLFAKEHNLAITNREGISQVSAKALEGKPIRLSIENYPPEASEGQEKCVDVCIGTNREILKSGVIGLCPRRYALGIGCRRGTPYEKIRSFLEEVVQELGIPLQEIGAIGSIDLKEDEEGILTLSEALHIPFVTYTKELLAQAAGTYEESDFVREKTGVGNVCERAAMLLVGNRGQILLRKSARDGVTLSIAKTGE